MISREEYLKAIDTIESYHKQITNQLKNIVFDVSKTEETETFVKRKLSSIKVGEYIVYVQNNGNARRGFTLNKKYRVLEKREYVDYMEDGAIKVLNDDGLFSWISLKNRYRRWEIA